MRVALCLYGLVGGKVGKDGKGEILDLDVAYKHYKKHILDKNDVDVFIHTWSVEYEDDLRKLYEPRKAIFEKQIDFSKDVEYNFSLMFKDFKNCISHITQKMIGNNLDDKFNRSDKRAFRAYSRWYSNKKTIELKKKYEEENNFQYDWVMVSRLDVAFFKDVLFENYDNRYFYASHWNDAPNEAVGRSESNKKNNHRGKGFLDFWFFSNSETMDYFGKLYDHRKEYSISPHMSSREHMKKNSIKIKYLFYRWKDHEMIRRYFLNSNE